MSISLAMRQALLDPFANLCWLAWFESDFGDLYAWTGTQAIAWDGHSFVGVGLLRGFDTIQRGDALSFRSMSFQLPGLDPQVLIDLNGSVKGKGAKLWLGALNSSNQVISDPILLPELVQDTIDWKVENGSTVTLTLNCYESLARLGKPSNRRWSHETQMARFSGDTGFYYNQASKLTGPALDWRQG